MTKMRYEPPPAVIETAKDAALWIMTGKIGDEYHESILALARRLATGQPLSMANIRKARLYFGTYEVCQNDVGFHQGEPGFPIPSRVLWDAWGGDAGRQWVENLHIPGDWVPNPINDEHDARNELSN